MRKPLDVGMDDGPEESNDCDAEEHDVVCNDGFDDFAELKGRPEDRSTFAERLAHTLRDHHPADRDVVEGRLLDALRDAGAFYMARVPRGRITRVRIAPAEIVPFLLPDERPSIIVPLRHRRRLIAVTARIPLAFARDYVALSVAVDLEEAAMSCGAAVAFDDLFKGARCLVRSRF